MADDAGSANKTESNPLQGDSDFQAPEGIWSDHTPSDVAPYGVGPQVGQRIDMTQAPKLLYAIPVNDKVGMIYCCCSDDGVKERYYSWVMENRIETNRPWNSCCPGPMNCCRYDSISDLVTVKYYDKSPVKPNKGCCGLCCEEAPVIEYVDDSYLCCCMECPSSRKILANCFPCCCDHGEALYVVPYETVCGCCSNRNGSCSNCCGCCGPKTGTPKVARLLMAGIKDAKAAKMAQYKLFGAIKNFGERQLPEKWTPPGQGW